MSFRTWCQETIDEAEIQIANAIGVSPHRESIVEYFRKRGVPDHPDYSDCVGLARELIGWSIEPSWPQTPSELKIIIDHKIKERGGI